MQATQIIWSVRSWRTTTKSTTNWAWCRRLLQLVKFNNSKTRHRASFLCEWVVTLSNLKLHRSAQLTNTTKRSSVTCQILAPSASAGSQRMKSTIHGKTILTRGLRMSKGCSRSSHLMAAVEDVNRAPACIKKILKMVNCVPSVNKKKIWRRWRWLRWTSTMQNKWSRHQISKASSKTLHD